MNEYEKGAVESFALTEINFRSNAKEIGRSKAVINYFLRLKDEYRKKNPPKAYQKICYVTQRWKDTFKVSTNWKILK